MRAGYSVPSYAVAFVGLRHVFIGNELTSLSLSKTFADGGFCLTVDRKARSIGASHRKNNGSKRVLLLVRELPHLCNGLFEQLGHTNNYTHFKLRAAAPRFSELPLGQLFFALVSIEWQVTLQVHVVVQNATNFNDAPLNCPVQYQVTTAAAMPGNMKRAKTGQDLVACL
jgi:hypothetical protein